MSKRKKVKRGRRRMTPEEAMTWAEALERRVGTREQPHEKGQDREQAKDLNMNLALDIDGIRRSRARHERLGIRSVSTREPPAGPVRAPDIRACWYRPDGAVFVVKYLDGTRAALPRRRLDASKEAHVVGCRVDDFRRGVEVALDDGSTASFSGDFVLYTTDPSFRKRADEATKLRRRARTKTFGERVREAREQLGWSLAELGERVGMAAPNIHRIERGQHTPSTRTVLLMSETLQRSVAWLLAGESSDE